MHAPLRCYCTCVGRRYRLEGRSVCQLQRPLHQLPIRAAWLPPRVCAAVYDARVAAGLPVDKMVVVHAGYVHGDEKVWVGGSWRWCLWLW